MGTGGLTGVPGRAGAALWTGPFIARPLAVRAAGAGPPLSHLAESKAHMGEPARAGFRLLTTSR